MARVYVGELHQNQILDHSGRGLQAIPQYADANAENLLSEIHKTAKLWHLDPRSLPDRGWRWRENEGVKTGGYRMAQGGRRKGQDKRETRPNKWVGRNTKSSKGNSMVYGNEFECTFMNH